MIVFAERLTHTLKGVVGGLPGARKLQPHSCFAALLADANIELLFKSACLHDIGKVGAPANTATTTQAASRGLKHCHTSYALPTFPVANPVDKAWQGELSI